MTNKFLKIIWENFKTMFNREYATLSPVPISIAQFLERGGRGKVGSVLPLGYPSVF